jgi:hypothetical protein
MTQPMRDPAGLLERAPELADLALAHPSLRRAIERGNAHATYGALWWGRLLGRLKAHRQTVDALLSHRRLFVSPLQRMPVLHTVNGMGAALYGTSDADADGTYVKTHFLVFVFVPFFPLSQYLVRDADRGWYFLGKVPMSAPVRLWNRLVVSGILLALAAGAFEAFHASRHHDVRRAGERAAGEVAAHGQARCACHRCLRTRHRIGRFRGAFRHGAAGLERPRRGARLLGERVLRQGVSDAAGATRLLRRARDTRERS